MIRRHSMRFAVMAGLAFCAMAWLNVGAAHAGDDQAFAVPASAKVLEGTLFLPDGQTGTVRVRDGAMIRLHDNSTGETYTVVPAISKEDPGVVNVLVLSAFKMENGEEGVEQVGDIQTQTLGSDGGINTIAGSFGVRFDRIGDQVIEDDIVGLRHDSLEQILAHEKVIQESSCCVSCDGYTVCACSVNLLCGSCCASGCCPGDGGRKPIQNF